MLAPRNPRTEGTPGENREICVDIWRGFLTESLQYFGVPIFGRTFDPLDYLMFATGVAGAFVFEWAVLSQIPREVTS